jgi:hypothetical protein
MNAEQEAALRDDGAEIKRLRALLADYDRRLGLRHCQYDRCIKYAELHAENERLKGLLREYRNGVPLGHQPHMIAHRVDAALHGKEGADHG